MDCTPDPTAHDDFMDINDDVYTPSESGSDRLHTSNSQTTSDAITRNHEKSSSQPSLNGEVQQSSLSPVRESPPVVFHGEEISPTNTNNVASHASLEDKDLPASNSGESVQNSRNNQHMIIEPNVDSLDASDVAFSQDVTLSDYSEASSETSQVLSDFEMVIPDSELVSLHPSTSATNDMSTDESGSALCEDIYSRIYYDFDDERYSRGHWEDVDATDEFALRTAVSTEELEERAKSQRSGGLEQWTYDSPFSNVDVRIDDVNQNLERRFLVEANTTLDRVIEDISSRQTSSIMRVNSEVSVSPLSCLKTFISDCLLEKLRYVANRVLHDRKKQQTTKNELIGLIIMHVLCASYNESPTTVCNEKESQHFFQMGISAERYHEVWSALGGSKNSRSTHDYSSTGWCRTANRATTVITEIESETAAVNRELLYVPQATVFSLDDDHLRMASRAVVELTYLQQHNNPKKGLGPVGNALCSALNPFFLACHFTRTGEKMLHTWERLVQLIQGASTNGSLRPMPDSIFAADRGYNSKDTIAFLSDVLGASLLGTHERDLWYPYVFGDGPISRRHKGMDVSEKGCRAVYTARMKAGGARGSKVRRPEACVYRESCSGRIAALIHNNPMLFPSRCFTVVLRETFRTDAGIQKLQESLVIFDDLGKCEPRSTRFVADKSIFESTGSRTIQQVLNRCHMLTYFQSEDPVWFLLRAFRFTSRTAHGFIAAVARDYDVRQKGLSWLLRGKCLRQGAESLSNDHIAIRDIVHSKWEHVISTLGMKIGAIPRPSSRRALAERIRNSSLSRINSHTKNDLQNMLTAFGRGLDLRASKADFVAAVTQLKADISDGAVELDETISEDDTFEEDVSEEASKRTSDAFLEASLTAWVMKPLVATAGMKEGSRNEVEIVRHIPKFFAENGGAWRRKMCSTTYSWDPAFQMRINHIRATGLLESGNCAMLADSPDALLSASDEDEDISVFAVEIKTMTSVRTIESATVLREKYGAVVSLENVGIDVKSTELFREMVPSTEYRAQVLHHAATLGINNVIFLVGTGGSLTEGRILYACVIHFTGSLLHSYTYLMDCVRVSCFQWVGGESKHIPKEYDELLKSSHASDIYSFVSYYSLSQALRAEIARRGQPIPPCRMIRLTPAVYWNNLKGGVDVISRYLKTLARSNISENPVVSIIARLLCMQVNNAAVIYRLYRARQSKVLTRDLQNSEPLRRGYSILRHRVTQCDTFGSFVRRLAEEWVGEGKSNEEGKEADYRDRHEKITPLFKRNATERYNKGIYKARRLNHGLTHKKVSGPSTYCVLCSWSLRGKKDGKTKIKRKGSRQMQWCSVCRQAVCSRCWIEWHTQSKLARERPTAAEVRAFEQFLRPKRRRIS